MEIIRKNKLLASTKTLVSRAQWVSEWSVYSPEKSVSQHFIGSSRYVYRFRFYRWKLMASFSNNCINCKHTDTMIKMNAH